ncbi:helix-turn-helix transcriptional regulator [Streptomyces sparsogenes]|uniref:Putative transcriptional regulator, XRE family protein n=1 Tax=Streptomyces sparsogenes DSM 40356 TaxID=1331668 RepID=A0A1R1S4F4_9ACTN|nr:helix-turn-helix transcriptional regulator [Streptomyces sparsogenes]OMI33180.1 putative transcriptional regulator, XRE family protein [Streptomyces sparsogenes DSM 40356]
MGDAEPEIKAFLRARRAALDPAELGLPDGLVRRRVRGLRREEVAQLAGISVDYYTRIEQGRAPAISDSVVDALARALRLTPSEHTYLRNITLPRREWPVDPGPRPGVRPEVRLLLEAMDETVPAFVFGPGADVLAWNLLGGRVCFDLAALPERERNSALLVFLHPEAKALHPEWDKVADETVAGLRAEAGRHPGNVRVCQVVRELLERSEDFRRRWEAQAVRERTGGTKRIRHPVAGELVLTYEAFVLPSDPGQVLCTYTAEKGSPTAGALRALARDTVPVG